MSVEFKPLDKVALAKLKERLGKNGEDGSALYMGKDTSFVTEDEVTDSEVIRAIRSVPCHY